MNHNLFSYGTLQLKNVQLESFGRILIGKKDTLLGFKIERLEITNEAVLAVSKEKFHPIAIQTNNKKDVISGSLYEISQKELEAADLYEVSEYKKVEATFQSGNKGWIYVKS